MNDKGDIKSVIEDNYQKAINYLKTNEKMLYFLCGFWCVVFVGAMLVDYGLSYDFFSQLARNDIGVVPDDLIFMVKLNACLGLSIVLLLEYSYKRLSMGIQMLVFWILFFMILFALWNIGGAQIFPLLNDYVQNEYTTEEIQNDTFREWMGVSGGKAAQTEGTFPEDAMLDESIGKKGFIKNAKWYRTAFLFFSFVGLVAIINISLNAKKLGQLSRAKYIAGQYRLREQLEIQIKAYESDIQLMEDNRENLYRAAKEEVLAAYTCGLRFLKARLHDLIIYSEKNKAFSGYSFLQIRRVKGLYVLNIEETKELIKNAEESLGKIWLGPDKSDSEDSLGENNPDDSDLLCT